MSGYQTQTPRTFKVTNPAQLVEFNLNTLNATFEFPYHPTHITTSPFLLTGNDMLGTYITLTGITGTVGVIDDATNILKAIRLRLQKLANRNVIPNGFSFLFAIYNDGPVDVDMLPGAGIIANNIDTIAYANLVTNYKVTVVGQKELGDAEDKIMVATMNFNLDNTTIEHLFVISISGADAYFDHLYAKTGTIDDLTVNNIIIKESLSGANAFVENLAVDGGLSVNETGTFGYEGIQILGLDNETSLNVLSGQVLIGSDLPSELDVNGNVSITGALNVSGPTTLSSLTVVSLEACTGSFTSLFATYINGQGQTPVAVPGINQINGIYDVSIEGTNTAGQITFSMTGADTVDGELISIFFSDSCCGFETAPFVVFSPASTGAGQLFYESYMWANADTPVGWGLFAQTQGSYADITDVRFNYHVIGMPKLDACGNNMNMSSNNNTCSGCN